MSDNKTHNNDEEVCECKCQDGSASFTPCTLHDPSITLQKLVYLITNPITANSQDRILMILNDFINSTTYAFWISDLPYIMQVIEILVKEVNNFCLYRKPLESLLSLCAMPPLLNKISDATKYKRDLEEYFSFLGYLLIHIQDVDLRNLIIQAICEIIQRYYPTPLHCISLNVCYSAIEASQLPKVVSNLLDINEESLRSKILKIILLLVTISKPVCHKIVTEKVIDILMAQLEEFPKIQIMKETYSYVEKENTIEHFEIITKILWILLDSWKFASDQTKCTYNGPSTQALRGLHSILRKLIQQTNNELNRNYVMAILLQCLDLFPNVLLANSGIVQDLTLLSVATEIGTGGTWASQIRFSPIKPNYEFKKMLLLAVCYCTKSPDLVKILHPKRIIPGLLKIITPELNKYWHPQEHSKLMSLALHTLQCFIPKFSLEFLNFNGPLRLLMIVECYNLESFEIIILKDTLQTLHIVTSIKNQNILENLIMHDANNIIMTLCEHLLDYDILNLKSQKCLAYAFSILELFCYIKSGYSSYSVNLCMKFLKRILNPNVEDPIFQPKFLIGALDFLWASIAWSENNLEMFASGGGVFLLLDLIQVSVFPVKLIALGALVDMTDCGSSIPHLITWRRNRQKLLPMLLQLFREENVKLEVKSTTMGIIDDIETPLMGQQQWYETYYVNKDTNSSPATVDLLGSCRPKIYALIHFLKYRHEDIALIANEHYQLYDENMEIRDQITLLIAENFLTFKLGEVWVELNKDVEKAGIRPLAIDGELIATLIHRFHKYALHIKTIQQKLLTEKQRNEYRDELKLYHTLRESKLVESLKAMHELDYIARTTERMFRFISKMKTNLEIDNSLAFTAGIDQHRTYMHIPTVTPVFHHVLDIQSNIIVDPKENSEYVELVSPISDNVLFNENIVDEKVSDITDYGVK